MKFNPPGRCFTFEIPDAWWREAGMPAFQPTSPSYAWRPDPERPTLPVVCIPIARVRRGARTREGGDFDRARMTDVLRGIARGDRIPPVAVMPLPPEGQPFTHRLYSGFHRFSASIAAGYTHVPVVIFEEF